VTLHAIRDQLRKRMHESVEEQGRWLQSVVRGYFAYHAVPTNGPALRNFRYRVTRLWRHVLSRPSQNAYATWRTMSAIVKTWLPLSTLPILGRKTGSPSTTQCKSPVVREFCTPGSVRGVRGNAYLPRSSHAKRMPLSKVRANHSPCPQEEH
jgi:hypothetical protein